MFNSVHGLVQRPAGDPCIAAFPKSPRKYATPGEARAAERGYWDYPAQIESSRAYLDGSAIAEKHAQSREDARLDGIEARRAESAGRDWLL